MNGGARTILSEPAPRNVVVRERARTQHSAVKPARSKVAVSEVRREKEVVQARDPEPMSTIPLPEPKSLGSLNPRPGWKPGLVRACRVVPFIWEPAPGAEQTARWRSALVSGIDAWPSGGDQARCG